MKQLIPVILAGAAIIVGITTGLAPSFSGHSSLSPYLIGYGCAALLVAIAAVMAIVAARRERARPILEPARASGISQARGATELHEVTLWAKTTALANEILEFLQSIGPRPKPQINPPMTEDQILEAGSEEIGAYVSRVHHTYLA
jgi:hypothetical protein